MTVNHDPRPASRYQAVTPGAYREATALVDRTAALPRAFTPAGRVLRSVPAQVVRIELAR